MAFEDLPGERWADVPGYEGRFQASTLGRVRSLLTVRGKAGPYIVGWRRAPDNRMRVVLSDARGDRSDILVSSVILSTFIGSRPPGMEAAHENDDPTDDRLANLAWKSSKANKADARRNGKLAVGERRWNARVTAEQVREIRTSKAGGCSWAYLAIRHGLTVSAVRAIVTRRTWQHVG